METSARPVSSANFEIEDNILTANLEHLYWEDHGEFIKQCSQLLRTPHKRIILDLSSVIFVFSAYVGTIGRLLTEAASQSKTLTVRINKNLLWFFELSGFAKMLDLEVVP
ncbi:MAG: hypothetical protein N3A66_07240 [Planctomycetota bacterium]|nr:hypothetical protein [Planctomycetota bacterium]